VLAAPIVWYFGFLSLFRPYTLSRAYADLPTVLVIVHCDGTHPIPPQYILIYYSVKFITFVISSESSPLWSAVRVARSSSNALANALASALAIALANTVIIDPLHRRINYS
jgi:hypothetical protein